MQQCLECFHWSREQEASPLQALAMQFHNYLFRQCTGAWKTAWDTSFPLGNAIREYVNLTNMQKAVPYWWTMKKTTSFFSGFGRCAPPCQEWNNPYPPINQTAEKYGDIVLPPSTCNVNLILSVPPLTMHLKLIRGEMSYLIIFDHEHWSVACNFDFRSACLKSFLKRAKYYPEIHRSLYYLSLWKDTLRGNECASGKLKIICHETLSERWTVSEERSPRHQSFSCSLFIAAVFAHSTFMCLHSFLAD